jgi:galactonate dehydratase
LKPACDEIAVKPLVVQDGFVELPTAPGHGIDIDVEKLRGKPYRDMGTRGVLRQYWEEFPRKNYAVAETRTGY